MRLGPLSPFNKVVSQRVEAFQCRRGRSFERSAVVRAGRAVAVLALVLLTQLIIVIVVAVQCEDLVIVAAIYWA